jgi:hypothetical protein
MLHDQKANNFGNNVLYLCRSTGLRVDNGRLGNDKCVGKFTFYCESACSVIDYMLLSQTYFGLIDDFTVGDFSVYSDHAPVLFCIK